MRDELNTGVHMCGFCVKGAEKRVSSNLLDEWVAAAGSVCVLCDLTGGQTKRSKGISGGVSFVCYLCVLVFLFFLWEYRRSFVCVFE